MYDFSIRCACEDPNMLTGVQFSLLMYRYLKDGNKSVSKVIFLEKNLSLLFFDALHLNYRPLPGRSSFRPSVKR